MPRSAGSSVENKFIRGLVTEATGLSFPEDASTETYDCVYDEDGTVSRRLGFDYESGTVSETVTRDSSVMNTFVWESVAGQRDLSFVVLQVGDVLLYYRVSTASALSANKHAHETDLTDYDIGGSPDVSTADCEFAAINGVLVVTHPYCQPFYVAYDPTGGTFSETEIDIKTRDFEGVPEAVANDNRPGALTDAHEYNLFNQGWYISAYNSESSPAVQNVLSYWDFRRSDFPSNADVWWLYKNSDELFDPGLVETVGRGNSPAPKGHYVFDPFLTTRSSADAAIGTVTEATSGYYRPRVCAAFASRVFYGGVDAEGYSNKIYFSQILEDISKIGDCYQINDPTSENLFDLLPTDGGVVVIPEIGNVVKLVSLDTSLLVFATNGIWSISGSQGIGFAANDYSVAKISSVPSLTASSFVLVEGAPIWWNVDGIYAASGSSNGLQIPSLTDGTIKSFFDDIPASEKNYVKAAYNPLTRVIQWLYRSTTTADTDDHYEYDRVLCFNTVGKSFYPWTISESDTTINEIVSVKGVGGSGETLSSVFFYVTTTPHTLDADSDLSFTQTKSSEYLDFTTEDYMSYGITGYRIRGDAQRKFQMNYVTVYMNRLENASCYFQGLWDFSTSSDSNRWTNRQQVYLDNPYRSINRRRLKIRGSGVALQLKFESETGKPFELIGWAAFETGNQSL